MKNFSEIIAEGRGDNHDSYSLLKSEITTYINKVSSKIPTNIKELIVMTGNLNLTSRDQLETIRMASKSQYGKVATELGITDQQVDMMHDMLKKAGKGIRLLPQYQSKAERDEVEAGKLAMSDLTIDLSTSTGRNAVAKLYTPLVITIANQYVGKSRLDRESLIGAGMEGLAKAINTWNPNGEGQNRSFKTYAGYTILHTILDEINTNGHDLSGGNSYNTKSDNYGAAAFDALSLSAFGNNDDGESELDHLAILGVGPEVERPDRDEQKGWDDVFKLMDKQFSKRDMDIFYRYFGIGPYYGKKEKSKDIAKSYGMSEGNIKNSVINKILKFLREDPKARNMMMDLRDIYTESVVRECINLKKNEIRDILYYDETYVLLESIARWDSKEILQQVLEKSIQSIPGRYKYIVTDCLTKDEKLVEGLIDQSRPVFEEFLMEMYPSENIKVRTNCDIQEMMMDIRREMDRFEINL